MAIKSGFFNSINHDRQYHNEDISEMFNGLFSDGVFKDAIIQDGYETNDKFLVSEDEGYHLIIGTGKAWFDKVWVLNDSKTGVTLSTSHLILPRIDAIALQIDKSDDGRNASIIVIQGIPAANPTRPEMLIDSEHKIYQYALAYVTVRANASEILQSDIENVVGTTETPYAAYLGSAGVNIKVANNLETLEPGWILDARQGKVLNDRIPFRFGMDADGNYGYYRSDNVFIPFLGTNQVIKIGSNITTNQTIDLKTYIDYRQFTVNKNFFFNINSFTLSFNKFSYSDGPAHARNANGSTWLNAGIRAKTSSINPSLSYDANNGILTVSNVNKNDRCVGEIYTEGNGVNLGDSDTDLYMPFSIIASVDIYLIH